MSDIYFEAIKLIVMVCFGFLVAMLTQARSKWADEFNAFAAWAKVAVEWAQQLYWAETPATRKGVVMEFLKSIRDKYKVKLTDEQLEVLLEAAVKQMNADDGAEYILIDPPEDGDDGNA